MRSTFEEEEEAPGYAQRDRELTLSGTTLLIIFFSLVLICGLFFGIGYSLGHRATTDASLPQTADGSAGALPSIDSRRKPSAAAQTATVAPLAPADVEPADTPSSATQASTATDALTSEKPAAVAPALLNSAPQPAKPLTALQSQPPAPTAALQPAPALPAAMPATGGAIMVQIAAVSNPADADALINALRRRGYPVGVRHDPGDKLLHVQVGPFATRADAIIMRQKLFTDGYYAIVK